MPMIRLQKYCSEKNLASRRKAEEYIKKGWTEILSLSQDIKIISKEIDVSDWNYNLVGNIDAIIKIKQDIYKTI